MKNKVRGFAKKQSKMQCGIPNYGKKYPLNKDE